MDLANLIAPLLIIGITLALGTGIFIYGIMSLALPIEGVLRDRLNARDGRKNGSLIQQVFSELFLIFVPRLRPISQRLYGSNNKFIEEIRQNLTYIGVPAHEEAVWQRITQHLIIATVCGIVGLVLGFNLGLADTENMLMYLGGGFCVFSLLGLLLPRTNLKSKAKHRQTEIYYSLSDVLDLIVICVESGMSFDASMQRVARECPRMAPEMGYELTRTLGEINAGIPRSEALMNMGKRTSVEELRSLCNMIVQSDKLGTSIAHTIRVFALELRTKRRQHAEELAQKAPVKMMFPLVFLIFPPLFVILLGPAVIQILDVFDQM